MFRKLAVFCFFFVVVHGGLGAQNISLPAPRNIINKTGKKIHAYAKNNGLVFLKQENHDGIVSVTFKSPDKAIVCQFLLRKSKFAGRKKCFSYHLTLSDKNAFERLTDQIAQVCTKKIDQNRCQQYDGKMHYMWYYSGSNESAFYTITCQKRRYWGF